MTIKKKMLLLALLPISMALIVGLLGGYQYLRLEKRYASVFLAEQLEQEIHDLSFTIDRYMVIREPELAKRWGAKQRKLTAMLEKLQGEGKEEEEILAAISDLTRQIGKYFVELTELRADDPFPEAEELRIRLSDNIMIKSHEMLALSERINIINQKAMRSIRRESIIVTVAGFIIATLVAAGIAWRVQRTVTVSVNALKKCTDALSSGDLECRTDLKGTDELSTLGEAFNHMARELKRSYDQIHDKSMEYEKLNRRLEETVRVRTAELADMNRLLVGAQDHQARVTQKARVQEQKTRDLWMRTKLLIRKTGTILCEKDHALVLENAMEVAREITGSRLSITGHFFNGEIFVSGIASRAPDAPACPKSLPFRIEKGGVYQEILSEGKAIRLTQEQLLAHPLWRGLPEGHVPLKGLLGVPVPDEEGKVVGLIMVTDKMDADAYTEEDEIILQELAEIVGQGFVKNTLPTP